MSRTAATPKFEYADFQTKDAIELESYKQI